MKIAGFDWDKGSCTKCERHGVSREEIEAFFLGKVWVAPDPKHSEMEERFLALGRTEEGKPMVVVFTLREGKEGPLIRPISARYMHIKEAKRYEKAFAKDKNK